jgi:hypothetical protein
MTTTRAARRFRITIRLTEAEWRALQETAGRACVTLSALIRRVLLGTKPPRAARRPPVEATLLVGLLDRLGCVASNLTRIACTLQVASPASLFATERDLARSLMELRSLRPELLRALGKRIP